MDFSEVPQWLQDSIPWFTVGTLIVVFFLSVGALVAKLRHKRSPPD